MSAESAAQEAIERVDLLGEFCMFNQQKFKCGVALISVRPSASSQSMDTVGGEEAASAEFEFPRAEGVPY